MSVERAIYRADIDGLRAIAVLAVVLFHAHIPGFGGGFVGVDVFFVISGYLITQLLLAELNRTGRIDLPQFYARRVRRLYPAIMLVIFTTIVVWTLFLLGNSYETEKFIGSIRYAIFGMANIFFERKSGGYFDGASDEMPLLHFWSLGVEEQFYLIFPLLILVSIAVARKLKTVNRDRFLLGVIVFVGICSFALSEYLIRAGRSHRAFFYMPARGWELAAGSSLVFLLPGWHQWQKRWACLLGFLGMSLMAMAVLAFDATVRFPGAFAILPVLGTMLLIAAGANGASSMIVIFLSRSFLVKIGLLSYGIYLWHWPLLAMAKLWGMGEIPSLPIRLGIIAFSFVAAQLSLVFVENPIRFGRLKEYRPVAVLMGAGVLGLALFLGAAQLRTLERRYYAHAEEFRKLIVEGSTLKYCWEGDVEKFPDGCASDFASGGSPSSRIVVWGNSHTGPYLPLFEKFVADRRLTLYSYAQGDGHFGGVYDGDLVIDGDRQLTERGRAKNEIVLKGIERLAKKGPVSVALTSRWFVYGGDAIGLPNRGRYFLDQGKTKEGTIAILERSLEKTFQTLTDMGVSKILLVLAYPEFKYPVMSCNIRTPEKCATPRSIYLERHGKIMDMIYAVSGRHKNVRVINPFDFLCNEKVCPQVMEIDGKLVPVVSDTDHPVVAVTRKMAREIVPDLEWLTSNE